MAARTPVGRRILPGERMLRHISFRVVRAGRHISILSAALLAVLTVPASAQRLAVGAKASTLGLGVEAGLGLTRNLAVRGTFTTYSLDRDEDIEGIEYSLAGRVQGAGVLVDLHPFGGALRLTGGMLRNGNRATLDAVLPAGGTVTIDGQTYSTADVQSITGRIAPKEWAPYAGIGFNSALVGGGRISLAFDVGLAFQGRPEASLTGQTTLTGPARDQFDAALAGEAAEIQAEIDDLPSGGKIWPVVSVGLVVRVL